MERNPRNPQDTGADDVAQNDPRPDPVVVRWADPQLPHVWQIGRKIDGAFRPSPPA